MPVICETPNELFYETVFTLERDFERLVVEFADAIFGPDTIYIDIKKRVKGHDIISIPDAYLIDMANPEKPTLFVVENEISSHDPFKHIGIQMLRFVTSFDGAKKTVRDFLMDAIAKDKESLKRLHRGCDASSMRNIDNYLDEAIYRPFQGLVVIDHAKPELHNVLQRINANISVLEFNAYESDNGKALFQFDTLYDELENNIVQLPKNKDQETADRRKRKERRALADTIIVPAQADGFQSTFIGENCWYAIRIGAAMKDRIKYIAAYQIRPISAVTHIAEVKDIIPYKDTGKYMVVFKEPAQQLEKPIGIKEPNKSPQSPVYALREELLNSDTLDDALS